MFASAFGVIPVAEHIQQQVLETYEDDFYLTMILAAQTFG